ncbi:acetate--CoA ligase family protein [Rhodococcus sp. 077-4]|uniref:acetate--CoA ligase family protein n=1 Tax=Rhodococcus sp. 077-4 TaxID=2789271 RepID=UPI0039F525FB
MDAPADTRTTEAALIAAAIPLHPGDQNRPEVFVPEHIVKALLRRHQVSVPDSVTFTHVRGARDTVGGLGEPLVVKAFGTGLLHKSDVGAVALGITRETVEQSVRDMSAKLLQANLTPDGYLVEKQHPGGTELIVGVVRDATFGYVLLLGLGGVATELLDLNALRVLPLSRNDAEELADSFPGAPLLSGARGRPPTDRAALVDFLLAIGGEGGFVDVVGPTLIEFECNPIVATPDGVEALDARLVLDPTLRLGGRNTSAVHDFERLFSPRSIAVAGASTSRSSFGNRFLAAYRQAGWTDRLVAVHPTADEIDGVQAYPSFEAIPFDIDYVVAAVPAAATPDLVASAAASKVGFVHVVTGGFAEMGSKGKALQDSLAAAVRGTDTRLLGPNCLGVFSPAGKQTFTLNSPRTRGNVSVVSQSGGLSGDMITVGDRRGVRYSKLVSIGNAIDVSQGEVTNWLVSDPDTSVIGIYLEGTDDGATLVSAFRAADGIKPIVVLRGGSSAQGSAAVSSHTGSMATSPKIWKAIADSTGVFMVYTLDHYLSALAYLQRRVATTTVAGGVLVVGLGGGASVLATDACDRAGLDLVPLGDDLRATLRESGFGAGTSVANPLEIPIGPVSPTDLLVDVLKPVLSSSVGVYSDVLVHVNIAAYYNYGDNGLAPLVSTLQALTAAELDINICVVTRNVDVAPAEDAAALAEFTAHSTVHVVRDFDEAATAIAAAGRFDRRRLRASIGRTHT